MKHVQLDPASFEANLQVFGTALGSSLFGLRQGNCRLCRIILLQGGLAQVQQFFHPLGIANERIAALDCLAILPPGERASACHQEPNHARQRQLHFSPLPLFGNPDFGAFPLDFCIPRSLFGLDTKCVNCRCDVPGILRPCFSIARQALLAQGNQLRFRARGIQPREGRACVLLRRELTSRFWSITHKGWLPGQDGAQDPAEAEHVRPLIERGQSRRSPAPATYRRVCR